MQIWARILVKRGKRSKAVQKDYPWIKENLRILAWFKQESSAVTQSIDRTDLEINSSLNCFYY